MDFDIVCHKELRYAVERRAAKLRFASLYEYFGDKIAKETKAIEAEQAHKTKLIKAIKTKVVPKKQAGSCSY